MKILKNNYDKKKSLLKTILYPRKHICENCNSELEYDESDINIGVFGAAHIMCPLCNYNNMLDGDEHDITLTKNNVEFPTHFYHTSVESGAIDNCNDTFVKECIQKAIDYFRINKNEYYYYTGTGTTMVYVFRYNEDKEYEVVVTKDYYSTYIPFEKKDY